MGIKNHKTKGPQSVRCGIITVSDTRDKSTDKSGAFILKELKENNHDIQCYDIVKDEQEAIQEILNRWLDDDNIDVIIMNGGTGIAKRDVTYEVVSRLIEKEMPGFGEIFRMLSYTEDIGSAAILSRAIAGVIKGKAVFSMPGSTGAVRLGITKLILPELRHIIFELHKDT